MATNMLLVAIVILIAAAVNLRRERQKIEDLLASDEVNVYIYLEPEAEIAPILDVYSAEALAQRTNAQWN